MTGRGEGRERVLVAMSGGVDSSMAAALLVEQGYDAIGATMQLWPRDCAPDEDGRACCSLSAVEDARRVAAALGIPYYVLDFQELFEESVIRDFVEEYARGRTPNPCVRCNQHVKFAAFLHRARQLGARYIATGHYARTRFDAGSGRTVLSRGVDRAKDQSYALHTLTQDQLASALFPLGQMAKDETRRRAARLGLGVAAKRDSQEICFVPGNDYPAFLSRRAPALAAAGPIVSREGRVLGSHPGVSFFTIGQKRGLRLPVPHPMFVLEIHPETNTLVVGSDEDLLWRSCVVEEVNWIAVEPPAGEMQVMAKVRYNMEEQPGVVRPLPGGRFLLEFREAQRAITPGQAAVFYQGEDVLGGGTVGAVGLAVPETG